MWLFVIATGELIMPPFRILIAAPNKKADAASLSRSFAVT
jgi:hypothetical protein